MLPNKRDFHWIQTVANKGLGSDSVLKHVRILVVISILGEGWTQGVHLTSSNDPIGSVHRDPYPITAWPFRLTSSKVKGLCSNLQTLALLRKNLRQVEQLVGFCVWEINLLEVSLVMKFCWSFLECFVEGFFWRFVGVLGAEIRWDLDQRFGNSFQKKIEVI